jgi:hypothetical protein
LRVVSALCNMRDCLIKDDILEWKSSDWLNIIRTSIINSQYIMLKHLIGHYIWFIMYDEEKTWIHVLYFETYFIICEHFQ